MTTGKQKRTISGHLEAVVGVCYSPDGHRLATASKDRTIRIWSLQTDAERPSPPGAHRLCQRALASSPDSNRLASLLGRYAARLGRGQGAGGVHRQRAHQGNPGVSSRAPTANCLQSPGAGRGSIRLWDAGTGQERRTIDTHGQAVTCVCFSPDGKLLASGATWATRWSRTAM